MEKHAAAIFASHRRTLKAVSRTISKASGIFLFLDYDGTLTPIRKQPSEATLSAETKALLVRLSALPDVTVSIVTGRSMKSIRRFVPLDGIIFAANHGLHIRYDDEREWIHPSALAAAGTLTWVRKKLRAALKEFSGAFVEDKQLTLSVHYRNCAPARVPRLKTIVRDIVGEAGSELRITKGKKVLEVRPPAEWGKGNAVLELLKSSGCDESWLAIDLGDDTTDEEAFRVLKKSGITVHVGGGRKTSAQYYVKDTREVLNLLRLMHLLRHERRAMSDDHSGRKENAG